MRSRRVLSLALILGVAALGIVAGGAYGTAASDPVAGAIAFFSARGPNGDNEIYSMNPDGSDVRNLTQNPADDRDPTWSADGTLIAFSTNRGAGGNYEIFVMRWDGSDQHNLTNSPENDLDPYWDYNSDADIFFVREIGGPILPRHASGDIFVMRSDGSGQTNLTNSPADDRDPARGFHEGAGVFGVLFATDRGAAGDYEIFTMASNGSGQTNLTNNPANDRGPVLANPWQFSQQQIAFSTNRGGSGNGEIFVMNADGTDQRQVTAGPASDRHPFWTVWSGIGITLVFSRRASGGNDEIYLYDNGTLTNLSNNAADDLGPSVSHRPPPPPAPPPPPGPPPPPPVRCRVPRVVGLRLARARVRIRTSHCSVGRVTRVRSRRAGRVIRQSPRRGMVKRRGFPVRLTVGRNQEGLAK
jgi:hypothetical protein